MSELTRRVFVAGSASIVAGLAVRRAAWAAENRLYRDAIVIDGLGGPGNLALDNDTPLTDRYVQDISDSGLTCVHVTILPVGTIDSDSAFTQVVLGIDWYEAEIDRHPDAFRRIRAVADIEAAKRDGRTGFIYGLQDGVAFEADLDRLDALHRLGIRIVQPTYNRRNLLGDGCLEPANAGLSKTGIEAVQRMNALGILVDLSHCGRQTAADAIRHSTRPVAFTHTGCFALAEHPRHRTDAELRAVAETGGVSGIYFMPYLSKGRQPSSADIIRHLEHMIDVAGEDHVSIGTDGGVSAEVVDQAFKDNFARVTRARRETGIAAPDETEEGYLFASDLNTPRRLETLADMLTARGHGGARIEKILGKNLIRVLAAAWRA